MKITNMRTNHVSNPVGFLLEQPSLSWIVEGEQEDEIKAVKVVVALDDAFQQIIYDSGFQKNVNSLAYQLDMVLLPRTRYYWKILLHDKNDITISSEIQFFETAKEYEPWKARWIRPSRPLQRMPLVRKSFAVQSKKIEKVRLYTTGLGLYEAYINGEKIGDEYLSPGFHSYDFWQQYQTYDLTDKVHSGENRLGFILGNGWYKGRFGFDGGYENLYGDQFELIAECVITYQDGSEEVVATDDSWEMTEGSIISGNIYDGEVQDANLELIGWDGVEIPLNETLWEKMEISEKDTTQLCARLSVPIKIVAELEPELIITPSGEKVLDFKQNMTGWLSFYLDAPKGTTVMYEVGEVLQEGNFYNANLRTAEAKFVYISNGKPAEVRPFFTYYGFRYAKLTGFDGEIESYRFKGCVLQSELEETGRITTANPDVNQLIQNVLWGQKGNFLDVPTDCPQRDERMGWTGDAQIFARTASYNMYVPAFYRKFMRDLRLEQQALNGAVPFVVPQIKPEDDAGFLTGSGAAAWSDAATVIPWVLYEQYGDTSLLREQYPIMKDWVSYIIQEDERSGGKRLWTTGFQFGDWLALDGKNPHSPMGGTDTSLVASVYYYYSVCLTAKAARVLGKELDAAHYEELGAEIKTAIQKEYVTPNGRLAETTQTAYILFLYFDLYPEELKDRISHDFYEKVIRNDVHLQTGFVGTPYFAETLSKHRMKELAYSLLLNEDYPSWLYAVKLGATTVWERWNSLLPDGTISGTDMNSLNHYAYGSIVEWMYRYVLGIQADPEKSGYRHFYLCPQPSGQLRKAEGFYHSASGRIESSWEILSDGRLSFRFVVPFGTTATILLPDISLSKLKSVSWITEATEKESGVSIKVPCGHYEVCYLPGRDYLPALSTADPYRVLLEYTSCRRVIFDALPMLRNNDVALNYLDEPFENFVNLPIVSNFVTPDIVEKINQAFTAYSTI